MIRNFKRYILLVVGALFLFSNCITTAEASSSYITFKGKGNGHGVGMSQWGAKGMADKKYSYDKILKFYYSNVSLSTKDTSKTKIRVLVGSKQSTSTFSSTKKYVVKDSKTGKSLVSLNGGQLVKVSYSKGYYQVYSYPHKKTFKTKNPVWITPNERYSYVRYKGHQYDGQLYVYQSSSKLNVVNHALLEDYVAGVLPYEMYPNWPNEALKAQSVAARTYAIKRLGAKGYWDVDDTINYQVYKGRSADDKRMKSLTSSTKGKILTYKGKYVDAMFHSSSGGHTLDAQYLWGNAVPYLKGKKDPYDQSDYVKKGWSYRISKYDLGSRYGIGTIKSIKVTKSAQGHPVTLQLNGTRKSITVSATYLRSKLGGTKVKSTYFSISQ